MKKGSGSLALLKLPSNTILSLDGSATQTLRKEEELIVITDMPLGFHLLSVRAGGGGANGGGDTMNINMSMQIGLLILYPKHENDHNRDAILLADSESDAEMSMSMSSNNFIARQYDPQTEEMSSCPLDNVTRKNLYNAIQKQTTMKQKLPDPRMTLIPYDIFTKMSSGDCDQDKKMDSKQRTTTWGEHLTNFISKQVLIRHNLTGHGDKIVPGSMDMDMDMDQEIDNTKSKSKVEVMNDDVIEQIQDGVSMKYRPIPCFDLSQGRRGEMGEKKSGEEVQMRSRSMKIRPQSHNGTRKYLASLTPPERTALFTMQHGHGYGGCNSSSIEGNSSSSGDYVFQCILRDYYNGKWEMLLGELQLSFVVFVCCSCLCSLEHWRDCIYMLSLVDTQTIASNPALFQHLMVTLRSQLANFDCSIFHDDDFAGDNVFLPAIQRITSNCIATSGNLNPDRTKMHDERCWSEMNTVALELRQLTKRRFGVEYSDLEQKASTKDQGTEIMDVKRGGEESDLDYESDDEDGPVIVPMEEIQESINRSDNIQLHHTGTSSSHNSKLHRYRERYPFLFAAISMDEDILMTCARILDDQRDVTLVREAAAYLEEVEAKR